MKRKKKFRRFWRENVLLVTFAGCVSAVITAWSGTNNFWDELSEFLLIGFGILILGAIAIACVSTCVSEGEESDTRYNISCVEAFAIAVSICYAFSRFMFR